MCDIAKAEATHIEHNNLVSALARVWSYHILPDITAY